MVCKSVYIFYGACISTLTERGTSGLVTIYTFDGDRIHCNTSCRLADKEDTGCALSDPWYQEKEGLRF